MEQDQNEQRDVKSVSERSLVERAWWVFRSRPTHFLSAARGYMLFASTTVLRSIISPPGVQFGENVRLQRLRSVSAEAPHASIILKDNSIVYENARLEAYGAGSIVIGEGSVVGDTRIISRYGITIGRGFLSSWNVFIQDFDPHPVSHVERAAQIANMVENFRPGRKMVSETRLDVVGGWPISSQAFPGAEVVIGDHVWLGANSTVLKGARIGSGSIVAAGAVVIGGTYPERSLLAGNPAIVVKELPP